MAQLKPEQILPASDLPRFLSYDAATGFLTWVRRDRSLFKTEGEWIRWNGRYAGTRAFTPNSEGHLNGFIQRRMYQAHRVAWALHYGEWPQGQIDHINGVRTDNRIENLRVVTSQGNARNTKMKCTNTSGVVGVSPFRGKWRATINHGGKQITLGMFGALEEASAARKAAEVRFGYHPNHGRKAS